MGAKKLIIQRPLIASPQLRLVTNALGQYKRGSLAWYTEAYKELVYDKGFDRSIIGAAHVVLAGKARYQAVESQTGVPWWFIGCIHHMESSCDFRGVLHNGEKIIGTGRKTKLVPKNRGPFSTWEIAAVDALNYDGLTKNRDWSIGMSSLLAERYNGVGYLKYHPEVGGTPYLYAMTSINSGFGKYVADGKWSPSANANTQVGFCAMVKELENEHALAIAV
jgi:lysozyme family protein